MAQSCIADTFHVDPTNKAAVQDAIGGQSLLSIYGVYEKLKGKSSSTSSPAGSAPKSSQPGASSAGAAGAASTPEAEAFKSQGNAAMQRKDYPLAIDLYSKAISLAPLNPIYLSNRAAAYSASHKHAEAQSDAELAVATDPKYTKAWSRLGLARFVLGDARGSMEAYEKGIESEGNGGSEAMKKGYKTAKEKLEEEEKEKGGDDIEDVGSARGAGGSGTAGGMPDLSALAGMFGGGGGGGSGGGPDLSSIMSNPMFASMAQNLMSNPETMNNLMQNPQLRQMAEKFGVGGGGGGAGGAGSGGGEGRGGGGGGGGMPDISALMQDPNIAEM